LDVAFPLTALYLGPIALWAYFARGRRMSRERMHMHGAQMNEGARLGPEYILDLPLAWAFGILFQYFAIAAARGQLGRLAPLGDAIKSDTLSVLSFEVGLFGWMAFGSKSRWRPSETTNGTMS
jgi:hypothetical protein